MAIKAYLVIEGDENASGKERAAAVERAFLKYGLRYNSGNITWTAAFCGMSERGLRMKLERHHGLRESVGKPKRDQYEGLELKGKEWKVKEIMLEKLKRTATYKLATDKEKKELEIRWAQLYT